jgi:succinate dehydrogenase / fumarate reductase membrane anchor subunit
MIGNTSQPKRNEGVWLWLTKIIAGLLVIVVLAIHFVINHAVAPGGLLTYDDVVRYYKVPIVPIMEVFFLVVVVGHCLLGLRSILLDLNPSQGIRRITDGVMLAVGSAAVIYGAWLVIVVASR